MDDLNSKGTADKRVSKKAEATLADALLRHTFSKEWRGIDEKGWLRRTLMDARRFVLDPAMSSFLADLLGAMFDKKRDEYSWLALNNARQLARLPHKITWVEFDAHERFLRDQIYYSREVLHPTEGLRMGWLLVEHDKIDTAFMMILCSSKVRDENTGEMIERSVPNPFAMVWTTDGSHVPYKLLDETDFVFPEAMPSGLADWHDIKSPIGFIRPPFKTLKFYGNYDTKSTGELYMKILSDELRYVWAFLASLNQAPISRLPVTAQGGFIARGAYRKYLDHTLITIKLPPTKIMKAARAIAKVISSPMRAHTVRGHWRKDHWHDGEQIWIKEHQRGDASLGFVTHDYWIKH